MSCYNWERGNIVLPSKEWAKFRKALLTAWNAKQDDLLTLAKRAHTAAKAAAKGKRGANRDKAIKDSIVRTCGGTIDSHGWEDFRSDDGREKHEAVCGLIYKHDWKTRTSTLSAPKKGDLKKVAVSKDARIDLPDATVTFTNKTRAVGWYVGENNRAVESAHEHWFANKLFTALGRIEWTRGTGGKIIGNDEYRRDSDHEGGGGNYVTHDFHMKTAAEKKAEAARRSSYGSYGRRW